ncbi:MAG: hypothetical protein IKW54_06185 [Bacteroidales bacterium]|nr:hypothetical protein [Bacteroidales bacterium]
MLKIHCKKDGFILFFAFLLLLCGGGMGVLPVYKISHWIGNLLIKELKENCKVKEVKVYTLEDYKKNKDNN